MMLPEDLEPLAERVIAAATAAGVQIVTAESCTGGLISGFLTAIPGASQVLERGFVTYSNAAKEDLLGVSAGILARQGAVSAECAAAMVRGALERSHATLALSVTGIAGPGGGTRAKPVGLVYLALLKAGMAEPSVECQHFAGDRAAVRAATVRRGLELLAEALAGCGSTPQG